MPFKKSTFMLLEALLGTFLFSVTTYVLVTMNTHAFSTIQDLDVNRRAWEVMDRQFTIVESMGLDDVMNQNLLQGEIERDNILYQWNLQIEEQEVLQIYLVRLKLNWELNGRSKSIEASTLMQASMTLLEGVASR